MKKINLIIILLAFLAIFTNAYSQNINDCLRMVYPNEDIWYNPDSIMVDSCYESPTFGKWFAKRGYAFKMDVYVFGNEALSFDTIVSWQDISSTFTSIKNGFQELEQIFGTFIIQRSEAKGSRSDSLFLLSPIFDLEFQNYHLFDSVRNALYNIDSISGAGYRYYPGFNDIPEIRNKEANFPFNIKKVDNDRLTIIFNDDFLFRNLNINIYNLLGNQIYQQSINNQEISIDISTWASGVYIVSIGRYSKLIII